MTQLEYALTGKTTPEMLSVAQVENRPADWIRDQVAHGLVVIPSNPRHTKLQPLGIGSGLRTKVNANLGTSTNLSNWEEELTKATVAAEAGADAIMDLSIGGDVKRLRQRLLASFSQPLGTVPIYAAAVKAAQQGKKVVNLSPEELLAPIREQAEEGVDFMTVHAGVTLESIARLSAQSRITDIVSRGGAFLAAWMINNQQENPYFSRFDEVLAICRQHDVTLSLGDGLRPGCLADATDRAQIQELILLGELARRCRLAGVQVMIEGPGHVPIDQIPANILLQKRLCEGAPFYVLGPLVTDLAAGHDHIACAIGGAIAAAAGADFLCYVTPTEHLRLPTVADVREGVIAARIAAHAGDLAKQIPGAWEKDLAMAQARKALDWEKQYSLALDPRRAREIRESAHPVPTDVCTMCGDFCAMKSMSEYLKK